MSWIHSVGFWLRVALPTLAKGVIIRRPWVVALAERFDLDARAVRYAEKLQTLYEERSVLIRNPIRPQASAFNSQDVRILLSEEPSIISPASDEKRSALGHFEP